MSMNADREQRHLALHMLPAERWQAWRDGPPDAVYEPEGFARDGFVHCTEDPALLVAVANERYQSDPRPQVVLRLDLDVAGAPWRYDDQGRRFPHVYGPLARSCVVGVALFERDPDGRYRRIGPMASVPATRPRGPPSAAAGAPRRRDRRAPVVEDRERHPGAHRTEVVEPAQDPDRPACRLEIRAPADGRSASPGRRSWPSPRRPGRADGQRPPLRRRRRPARRSWRPPLAAPSAGGSTCCWPVWWAGARRPPPSALTLPRAGGYHPRPAGLRARPAEARRPRFVALSATERALAGAQPRASHGVPAPVNNKPTYLSRDGQAALRLELEQLVNVRRAEVAARIHDAKEHGDLSENAEYEEAKNEQAFVEGRIQTLEAMLKTAVIIENAGTEHVALGSTVEVESEDGPETFTIVGSAEARPTDGKISNESPVGRALLGRKAGEKVSVRLPNGSEFGYTIKSIS
jgi:transcription elongation factor GreA